jgi:hypothetical protein
MRVFVFGSNLAGRHGKGAAKYARDNYGAQYGNGWGPQGQSYAIPTKDENLKTLNLAAIEYACQCFLVYAREHPELEFDLTPIGCGLAGYKREQIKPFFKDAPSNVHFTKEWNE